jgi:hypothetical protein
MPSTPNPDSAFRTIELPPPTSSFELISPTEEEIKNQIQKISTLKAQCHLPFSILIKSYHLSSLAAKKSRIHLNSKGGKFNHLVSLLILNSATRL